MDQYTTTHNCFKLLIIAAITFFSGIPLKGQSFLNKMGNGLTAKVNCSCVDSMGNVYAVTSKSIDTTVVNRWNVGTNTWSVYTVLPKFYTYSWSTCNFLFGKFYLTGQNTNNSNNYFMEYSGSWKIIANFKYSPTAAVPMNSIWFSNKLYFVGGFDSIGGNYIPSIAAFNGSVFSNAGLPGGYFSGVHHYGSMDIVQDTLLMTYGNKILSHTSPSGWSIHYTNPLPKSFNSLAIKNSTVYASSDAKIYIIRGSQLIDSTVVPNGKYKLSLISFKNQIYINDRGSNLWNIYNITNKKDLKFIFSNQQRDSNVISFVKNANRLFYFGLSNVIVNGVNYRYIVEVDVDSLAPVGFDTIKGLVFWDKNNNYIKDTGDVFPKNGFMQNLTYNFFNQFGNNGAFEDIVLDNSNIEYQLYSATFDSCVQFRFSGNIKSKNIDQGVTIDNINFPLGRLTTSSKNLVLKNLSRSRARMMDSTIQLVINVKNKDCNLSNTTNGSVTLTLDDSTVFLNSVPAYTSKNGNVFTYNNLTFNYATDNLIKINVMYPNSSYSLGEIVRHRARIGNITGEDTMDNLDSIVQKLVYSYDPNAKYSIPEGRITKDLKNVRYHIDFQNEGNADAIRVTVVDTLNLKIPVYEFKMVGSSHPYKVSITPGTNIVTWVFDNINLKPKSENEAASKGYLIFDAKLVANMKIGDSIRNKASIYFDYNQPIITNYAVISRVEPKIKIDRIELNESKTLTAYPNPAQHFISIENTTPTLQKIKIYDLKGALIKELTVNGNEVKTISTEIWDKGLYVILNEMGEGLKVVVE